MKRVFLSFSILCIVLGFFGEVNAGAVAKTTKTFIIRNCAQNITCDLKSFSIEITKDVTFIDGIPSFGTQLYAEFETKSIASLAQYGLVQFIRGCVFESIEKENGEIEILKSIILERHFENEAVFCFPDWVIDSKDRDPLYNSVAGENRLHYYRWNTVQSSYDKKTEHFFGERMPREPRLYVLDDVSTAFVTGPRSAQNVSLEMKICIYKISEIPRMLAGAHVIDFAEPIACHEWSSNYIYDHQKKKFTEPSQLHNMQ